MSPEYLAGTQALLLQALYKNRGIWGLGWVFDNAGILPNPCFLQYCYFKRCQKTASSFPVYFRNLIWMPFCQWELTKARIYSSNSSSSLLQSQGFLVLFSFFIFFFVFNGNSSQDKSVMKGVGCNAQRGGCNSDCSQPRQKRSLPPVAAERLINPESNWLGWGRAGCGGNTTMSHQKIK